MKSTHSAIEIDFAKAQMDLWQTVFTNTLNIAKVYNTTVLETAKDNADKALGYFKKACSNI